MGPAGIILGNITRPFVLFKEFLCSLIKAWREALLFLCTGLLTFSILGFFAMVQIHEAYYRHCHRGLWEDVMVSLVSGANFSSLEEMEARFQQVRRGLSTSKQIAAAEKTFAEQQERLKADPRNLGAFCARLHAYLPGQIESLVVSGRMVVSGDISRVLVNGEEAGVFQGQMDLWIKAVSPRASPGIDMTPPVGEVWVSETLRRKLTGKAIGDLEQVVIYLGIWGNIASLAPFQVRVTKHLGSGESVFLMHPDDLKGLGITPCYNSVGIHLKGVDPQDVQRDLQKVLGPDYRISTLEEKEMLAQVSVFLQFPYVLLGLLLAIFCIAYVYLVIHNWERHREVVALLSLLNHDRKKTMAILSIENVIPGLFGMALALILLFSGWPFSWRAAIHGSFPGFEYTGGAVDLFFRPLSLYGLAGLIVFMAGLSVGYLFMKVKGTASPLLREPVAENGKGGKS